MRALIVFEKLPYGRWILFCKLIQDLFSKPTTGFGAIGQILTQCFSKCNLWTNIQIILGICSKYGFQSHILNFLFTFSERNQNLDMICYGGEHLLLRRQTLGLIWRNSYSQVSQMGLFWGCSSRGQMMGGQDCQNLVGGWILCNSCLTWQWFSLRPPPNKTTNFLVQNPTTETSCFLILLRVFTKFPQNYLSGWISKLLCFIRKLQPNGNLKDNLTVFSLILSSHSCWTRQQSGSFRPKCWRNKRQSCRLRWSEGKHAWGVLFCPQVWGCEPKVVCRGLAGGRERGPGVANKE